MTLTVALARTEITEPLLADPSVTDAAVTPISRAFAPMVREQRFDVSEMAIATFLMAREAGSDLVLLPIVLLARPQHGALLRRAADRFGPDHLRGKRIGVRAYSQTTGLWLRGILQDDHGLPPDAMRWTTFEDAHVPGFKDPPWAERAPPGANLVAMLRDGHLDAAIFGADLPAGEPFVPVFPDPAAASTAFRKRHGFHPINHLVTTRADIARDPAAIALLARHLHPATTSRAALAPALALAIRYAAEQGLLRRPLTLDEVWAGLPEDIL